MKRLRSFWWEKGSGNSKEDAILALNQSSALFRHHAWPQIWEDSFERFPFFFPSTAEARAPRNEALFVDFLSFEILSRSLDVCFEPCWVDGTMCELPGGISKIVSSGNVIEISCFFGSVLLEIWREASSQQG